MPLIPSLQATIGFLFQFAFVVPFIVLAALAVRRLPKPRALIVALLVAFFCSELQFIRLEHVIPGYDRLNWNWGGKIASTIGILIAIPSAGLTFEETGFRRSEKGSIASALIAGLLICLCSWGYSLFFFGAGGTPPTTETLLFQATMPGLSEEPFFRALMPILFDRALPGRTWRILGVDWSVGMVIATVWFGLAHGVGLDGGHVVWSLAAVLSTGVMGLGLAWIYLRTRSLILPILFHNLINVGLDCLPYAHMVFG